MEVKMFYRGAIVLASLMFIGCGSSGSPVDGNESNGTGDGDTQAVKGFVLDPAISGSLVKLCETSDLSSCLSSNADRTEDDGSFEIKDIAEDVNLSQYTAVAKGGTDVETLVSFADLTMTAPAVPIVGNQVIVSPISSLLLANGLSVEQLKAKLGISSADVSKDPTMTAKLQRLSLILADIARKNGDKGFEGLTDKDFDDLLNDQNDELKALAGFIDDQNDADPVVARYNTLRKLLSSSMYKDSAKGETELGNVEKWAVAILGAAEDKNVSNPNIGQIGMLFLASPSDLNLSNPDLNISKEDINATQLAGIRSVLRPGIIINHKEDLADALGEDSDITGKKMRDYYYGSTASHLYQTEELVRGMNDVSLTDSIYAGVAAAYAKNGIFDEAEQRADSKIFQGRYKASTYSTIAYHMIGIDNTRSEVLYDKAFETLKKVTDAMGVEHMGNRDIIRYRVIQSGYLKIGKNDKSDKVNKYLMDASDKFTESGQYLSFIVGLYFAADDLTEEGDAAGARAALEDAETLADNMPIQVDRLGREGKKAHVFAYVMIAQRYIILGDKDKAVTVADKAQALRLNDGIASNGVFGDRYDTSSTTIFYAAWIAGVYANAEEFDKAYAVLDTMVGRLASRLKERAITEIAKSYAIQGDLGIAFDLVDNNISSYKDKIKTLTYLGNNKKSAFMALALLELDKKEDVLRILDKAVGILEQAIADGEERRESGKSRNYVKWGYAKLANLYFLAGDDTKAETYFGKAIDFVENNMSDAAYQIEALADWGGVVNQLVDSNMTTKAAEVIEKAYDIAKAQQDAGVSIKKALSGYYEVLQNDQYTVNPEISEKVADAIRSLINGSLGDIGERTNDSNRIKIVKYLVEIAKVYNAINRLPKAINTLDTAVVHANEINSVSSRMRVFIEGSGSIIGQYTNMGLAGKALDIIENHIPFAGDKRGAIVAVSGMIQRYDAFSEIDIAIVDRDKDGKADFFAPGTTQDQIDASGLELDDDNDNDGVLNEADMTPFFANP